MHSPVLTSCPKNQAIRILSLRFCSGSPLILPGCYPAGPEIPPPGFYWFFPHSGQFICHPLPRRLALDPSPVTSMQSLGFAVNSTQEQLQRLAAQFSQLMDTVTSAMTPPVTQDPNTPPPAAQSAESHDQTPPPESASPCPEKFSGDSGDCVGFLFQCKLVFNSSPQTFASDQVKISYVLRLLTGRALRWAEARFPDCQSFGCSFQEFVTEFKTFFSAELDSAQQSRNLLSLKQRGRRVSDFSVEFRTFAAAAGWQPKPLKAELEEFEDFVALAIRLDSRLRSRNRARPDRILRSPPVSTFTNRAPRPAVTPPPEPMQLGQVHLTNEERQQRYSGNLCLYCGGEGHFLRDCPVRPKDRVRCS
uniref:CCHC-type domain-containing protein n=1 Tax=Fundulus heteroclitus TaxID=8078 RepID=A0A3Q2NQ14_FUNHE